MRFDAILFDLDDTLVYFDDYWTPGMREAFRTFPLTADSDLETLYPVFLEQDARWHVEWLDGRIDGGEFRRRRFLGTMEAIGLQAGDADAAAFHRWFRRARAPFIPRNAAFAALLRRLAKRYALGIVTIGDTEDQRDKLKRAGFDRIFPEGRLFVSDRMGVAKPHPDAYLGAVRALGAQPERTLFVGDSWANDVAGPIGAGLAAVWLNRKGHPVPESPEPLAVIGSLGELEGVLAAAAAGLRLRTEDWDRAAE